MWTILDKIFSKCARVYQRNVFLSKKNVQGGGDLLCYGKVYFFGAPRIQLGSNVRIWPGVSFAGDGTIVIGDNVSIGKDCNIYASKQGGVSIGDDVAIAAQCYIIDSNHRTSKDELIRNQALESQEIIIEHDVWISAGCAIVKGAKIRDGAVIGAGAVVNTEIPAYGIAAGVPARVIRMRT
ncbi:MAG: acyltransferase [Actinomycetota bacterium]|nr:MAG: galactoside [Actinomycetota bacterium]MDO8949070.1 acyltransferase [Actinomycetota bacterium]MDP3630587.1 acyltransferase [Actinomycetota bacterium]